MTGVSPEPTLATMPVPPGAAFAAAVAAADPFDGRRCNAGGAPALQALSAATILDAADARTALALGRLVGEGDEAVLVAVALAVRAVRLGHVYVDLTTVEMTVAPDIEEREVDLAALPWPDPLTWPERVAASALTASGPAAPPGFPLRLIGTHLYLDRYWRHERSVVEDLIRRSDAEATAVDIAALAAGLDRLFPPGSHGQAMTGVNVERDAGPDLQRLAAATAVLRRFAVVAGGPGTGKTTTVARILALLHEQARAQGLPPPRVALAAPTGKAAARLAEAVHAESRELPTDPSIRAALLATPASTLHRLLGWQPGNQSRFRHDADNRLPHNVVIVDECSMVSLSMMARLLEAVRPSARLVLVGDPRQLASVEAGAVLGDIVGPAAAGLKLRPPARAALEAAVGVPVSASDPGPAAAVADGIVALRRVHRFGGGIAAVADAIDCGDPDAVVEVLRSGPDSVRWIEAPPSASLARTPELTIVRDAMVEAARRVVGAARRGDGSVALEHLRSLQVLCARRRGPAGAAVWRAEIERWLRTAIPGYAAGPWHAGRPLLVTQNDYALGVYNGDTGVVVDTGGGRLRAVFDRRGELLAVRPTRLASVESLYAMTIHKAQGSQFRSVVVVLPEPTSAVLTRELMYTAVTRAEAELTLVGSEAAVRAAVSRPIARASGLGEALWPPAEAEVEVGAEVEAPAESPSAKFGHLASETDAR